jgi:hypothetical protein
MFLSSAPDDIRSMAMRAFAINVTGEVDEWDGKDLACRLFQQPRLDWSNLQGWIYDQLRDALKKIDIIQTCYSSDVQRAELDLIEKLGHSNGIFSLQEELMILSLHGILNKQLDETNETVGWISMMQSIF